MISDSIYKGSLFLHFLVKETGCRIKIYEENRVYKKSLAVVKALVPEAGIEPALPKEQDFESSASTSSATRAFQNREGKDKTIFLFNCKPITSFFNLFYKPLLTYWLSPLKVELKRAMPDPFHLRYAIILVHLQ